MRYALLLLFFTVQAWAAPAAEWLGPVGPSATLRLSLRDGRMTLTFEERWGPQRSSSASGSYSFEGDTLLLDIDGVTFAGDGAESREPAEGFVVETPRKGVLDDAVPRITLRPGAHVRLQAVEDDGILQLTGNGGFGLSLFR